MNLFLNVVYFVMSCLKAIPDEGHVDRNAVLIF